MNKNLEKHIAFITYETPFAPGGGIAAVMSHLPRVIQSISQVPTYVITPFHYNIERTSTLEPKMDTIGTLGINLNSVHIKVEVKIYIDEVSWIFLKPQDQVSSSNPLFAGKRHPYDVPSKEKAGQSNLLRDALFFGRAASAALKEICPECSWTVLLQDWEAATCMLSFAQSKKPRSIGSTFLILHNSYDSGIDKACLAEAGINDLLINGDTVLEIALQLVQDPIITVSDQFALDLSSEMFQSEIMIPHIVDRLGPRIYGINNGPFINMQIPEQIFQAGLNGDSAPLSDWKKKMRTQALKIIREFSPGEGETVWGDNHAFTNANIPWFVMAGRDDSRQKGYEVACLAVDKFLKKNGDACFIFFPIPGDEGLKGIQFIQDLASEYPSRVLCFPFLFREGYFPILQGATYGMMPSYYEPFGMANEFFLNGLSCLGRATGGIIQQIVPYRAAKSFSAAVSARADRWHSAADSPSGFLFREQDGIESELDDWIGINQADYSTDDNGKNRIEERREFDLVAAMSDEMSGCINDAVILYINDHEIYLDFIIDGASYISRNFSWEKTSQKYLEQIKM